MNLDIVPTIHSFDLWSKLSERERRLRAARAIAERDTSELWSLLEAYLLREKGKLSLLTLKAYKIALEKLLSHWQDVDLLHPGEDRAIHYMRRLSLGEQDLRGRVMVQPLSPSTVEKRIVVARHFYEALRWVDLLKGENPFNACKVESDKVLPEDKRSAYKLQEACKLFEAALIQLKLEDDRISILTFLAAFTAGLRLDELRLLTWKAIDFDGNKIQILGKGNKFRLVPLADCYKRVLLFHQNSSKTYVLEHIYKGKVSPFSDTYLRKHISLLCQRAGIPERYKAVHSLRHSFGYAMHKVLPLFVEQKIMGHGKPATTSIYAAPTSEDAVNVALGEDKLADPYERHLLDNKNKGVNALGHVLEIGLNDSLRAYWDRF